MTTIMRTLVVSAMTLLLAVPVAAQETAPAERLTVTQVQELVATATTPADHLQLQRHFIAVAERYEAGARQHTDMGARYGRNPNRRAHTAGPAHCRQLAQQATETASVVRALAAHHERLAAGLPSTPPAAAAPFEHGAGTTDRLNDSQAQELAAGAQTPGEHIQLQRHFAAVATEYRAEAEVHARMARAYKANPNRRTRSAAARHCERLVQIFRESARTADALAAEHEAMTRAAGTQ